MKKLFCTSLVIVALAVTGSNITSAQETGPSPAVPPSASATPSAVPSPVDESDLTTDEKAAIEESRRLNAQAGNNTAALGKSEKSRQLLLAALKEKNAQQASTVTTPTALTTPATSTATPLASTPAMRDASTPTMPTAPAAPAPADPENVTPMQVVNAKREDGKVDKTGSSFSVKAGKPVKRKDGTYVRDGVVMTVLPRKGILVKGENAPREQTYLVVLIKPDGRHGRYMSDVEPPKDLMSGKYTFAPSEIGNATGDGYVPAWIATPKH